METSALERTQRVPVELERAFEFFADPQNLAAITPPWLRFRIVEAPGRAHRGALIRYRLRIKGVPVRWLTEITDWRPPHTFTDVQLSGPYLLWEHTHRLGRVDGGTEIYDHVRYRVPGGAPVDRLLVRPLLDEIFDHRRARIAELLGA
ncbi:MAG TPA: SRPBCC family protein [Gaiellaceae bacterium]|nr:SRPBCC family protein [Gaiellaceae bacterium]